MASLSENDIRPRDVMAEQAKRYANDVARLMRHREHFIRVACPACDQWDDTPAFEKDGMPFVACNRCDTIYANPRPRPEHMEAYYRESENYHYWNHIIFPASLEARRERIFKPRVALVAELCRKFGMNTRTLLEVGAGFGIFCEEMNKYNLFSQVIGIEPTPDLAETCRNRGIEILEKPVEQVTANDLTGLGPVDAIASFEVVEHLFSPRQFLEQCARLLAPGGLLVLTCPNVKGFDVTVLKDQSSAFDVEHVNLFHSASLSGLLEACGFDVVEASTPGKLDADLVRNAILAGKFDVTGHPFLKQILIDEWDAKGEAFQAFLRDNGLSSHMMLVARRRP